MVELESWLSHRASVARRSASQVNPWRFTRHGDGFRRSIDSSGWAPDTESAWHVPALVGLPQRRRSSTGTGTAGAGRGRRRRTARVVAVGRRGRRLRPSGAARRRGGRPRRRPARARLRRRPRAPVQGGLERIRCDLSEAARPARTTSPRSRAYAAAHPDAALDPGRRLGDAGLPRRHADGRRPRPRWCPTGRCSCPTATTTAPGSTRRALELAGVDRAHPRPARRPDRARRRRPPTGTLHEGAMRPGGRATLPRTTGEDYYAGAAGRAGATCTRSASPPGRTRSSAPTPAWTTRLDVPARRGERRPARPTWSARCGGTASAGVEQVADLVGAARGDDRAAGSGPPRVKIMQDGVAENCTAALTTPYLDRCGHPTDNRGHSFVEPGALREAVAALDAAGLPGARPRDRRPRRARGARRVRGHRPPAPTAHHIAHLQLVHPDDVAAVRRARRRRQHAGALGLPRRPDGRPDAAVPRARSGRAGSTRSATCTAPAPGWSPAATGRSARPTRWPRSTPRSTARRTARPAAAGHEPFLPEQALDPRDRVRGVHLRLGVGEPPRRRRRPPRRVPSPTWSCSTATRSPARPRRSARPAWSRRGSTERRSSKPDRRIC